MPQCQSDIYECANIKCNLTKSVQDLKIVNYDYPLTIPKQLKPSSSADGTLLNFVGRGASTACSVFKILDRSDGSMFHPELRSGR
jgi:hypothetical protein